MTSQWEPPVFSTAPWYSDPGDHRCPHDAWLESVEIREPSTSARGAARNTAITVKLLGAYQDGWITLSYFGVRSHALTSYQCDQGVGDWLRDEFTPSDAGLTTHRITWCAGAGRTTQWLIEAEKIEYA